MKFKEALFNVQLKESFKERNVITTITNEGGIHVLINQYLFFLATPFILSDSSLLSVESCFIFYVPNSEWGWKDEEKQGWEQPFQYIEKNLHFFHPSEQKKTEFFFQQSKVIEYILDEIIIS